MRERNSRQRKQNMQSDKEKNGMCSLREKGTSLEKASVMWRKLLIAGQIWLKLFHFIYSVSFNPHHNCLKWLLFYHDTEMRKLEHRGLKNLFDHLFVVKHVCRVTVDPTNLQYWSCSVPGEFHGQRSLVGYKPWGHKRVRRDLVTKQQQCYVHIYH